MKRLQQLNSSGRGMDLGLSRVSRLASAMGISMTSPRSNQDRTPKLIHIAGTNGKGTVAHKIQACLLSDDKKVGLFTSPHVSSYRERIRINDEILSESAAEFLFDEIEQAKEFVGDSPTYFEALTLMAFLHFEKECVDVAIIEAGLGGKEDSTNIIANPDVCVITSISLDHQEFLGNTIEEIAAAKAGILKKGCHVVVGPQACHEPVLSVLRGAATNVSSFTEVEPTRSATLDEENSLIALEAASVLGCIKGMSLEKLLNKRPPGRFEVFNNVVLDGAHNPDAFSRLRSELYANFGSRKQHFVMAMSASKDIAQCLRSIFRNNHLVKSVYLAPSENESRGAKVDDLVSEMQRQCADIKVETYCSLKSAFDAATTAATSRDVIVVCGSFNALGVIRQGFVQDAVLDAVNMNENKV